MKQPLVSIAVITFNSSDFIIEALESVRRQTYGNIELIISDDNSTDDTILLAKEWLLENENRFQRVAIIESMKNTGPSGNYNRAESACRGEWMQCLDGDDILCDDCVETYIDYIIHNPNAKVVFSKVRCFGQNEEVVSYMSRFFIYDFFNWGIEGQLNFLTQERNCIPSGSFFVNLDEYRRLGISNDERIPLLEDWPKWINMLRKNMTFYFIDKYLVHYRLSSSSLCTGDFYKENYNKSYASVFIYYQFLPYCHKYGLLRGLDKYIISQCVRTDDSIFWYVCRWFTSLVKNLKNKMV